MGRKVFIARRKDGNVFFVENSWNHKKQNMEYKIYKVEPYAVVRAMEFSDTNFLFLWDYTPTFDSFVHAVAYMKRNIDLLV